MSDQLPLDVKEKVKKALKENSPISVPKIAKMLGIHKRFVETVIKELKTEGSAEYSGGRMWKWTK